MEDEKNKGAPADQGPLARRGEKRAGAASPRLKHWLLTHCRV